MLNKRITRVIMIVMTASFIFTGCSEKESNPYSVSEENLYATTLEKNTYYIRHKKEDGYETEKIYCGMEKTMDDTLTEEPSNERILMFSSDWDKVPTIYEGEDFIFFSPTVIDETYNFERFEDLGYSVGMFNMEVTKSGRYSIATEEENFCKNSDAAVLAEYDNAILVVDKIGKYTLRVITDADGEIQQETIDEKGNVVSYSDPFTRAKTISGLTKNKLYAFSLYDGTIERKHNLTANIRYMASMENVITHEYKYESDILVSFKFPDFFNSGYYMVDGGGIVRYITAKDRNLVKTNADGTKNFDAIDFTKKNIPPEDYLYEYKYLEEEEKEKEEIKVNDYSRNDDEDDEEDEEVVGRREGVDHTTLNIDNGADETFSIDEPGKYKLIITFDDSSNKIAEGMISTPYGQILNMENRGNSMLSAVFNTEQTGYFEVYTANTGGRTYDIRLEKID